VKLFEYQAKDLFRDYGIPVPRSALVSNPADLRRAISNLHLPVVLKSQVLAGGRGKAGGIVVAGSPNDVLDAFDKIRRLPIGGEKPTSILIEEAYPHQKELYLSVTLDRGERAFIVIASAAGGVEVEGLSGKIVRKIPLGGITSQEAREVSKLIGLSGSEADQFVSILIDLERMARERDCELAEINPLAVGSGSRLLPLDAKVIIDDSALFRHPEFSKLHPEDEFEGEASRQGFAFVRLDGDIAVVGNGAGLVLSTLDLVGDAGGNPACFLDLGGGAQQDRIEAALRLVNRLPNATRVLVNIFGGITRTTDVAQGVQRVISEGMVKPIFARISGAEEEQARRVLEGTAVRLFGTAQDAVDSAVAPQ